MTLGQQVDSGCWSIPNAIPAEAGTKACECWLALRQQNAFNHTCEESRCLAGKVADVACMPTAQALSASSQLPGHCSRPLTEGAHQNRVLLGAPTYKRCNAEVSRAPAQKLHLHASTSCPPGSPTKTGLFLVRRHRTRMTLRISSSRPITGSRRGA